MPTATKTTFQARKTPVQSRSTDTVQAILQAALQVLVKVGKDKLTTTRVATRAGVSVGTLYQYFPNKSSLLQACLRNHMQGISHALHVVCNQYRGQSLLPMTTALTATYLEAKMQDVAVSAALYAISSDIEGAAIAQKTSAEIVHSMAELLATAKEGLTKDPEIVASVLASAMNGISRRALESASPIKTMELLRGELLLLVHSYLRTCSATPLP